MAGLSELSFDPRPEIRKSALQILFDTLRNHGHLFSLPLWQRVFESVLFRIFDYVHHAIDPVGEGGDGEIAEFDQDSWLYETCTLSLELIVDLFVKFYSTVNPLLKKVLMLLVSFIRRPHQSLAGIGIAAFVRLISTAGDLFSDDKWFDVASSLKEAAVSTLPDFSFITEEDSLVKSNEEFAGGQGSAESNGSDALDQDSESLRTEQLYAAISDVKCRCSVQLLLIQVGRLKAFYSLERVLKPTTEFAYGQVNATFWFKPLCMRARTPKNGACTLCTLKNQNGICSGSCVKGGYRSPSVGTIFIHVIGNYSRLCFWDYGLPEHVTSLAEVVCLWC